jgi:hypothetical protein
MPLPRRSFDSQILGANQSTYVVGRLGDVRERRDRHFGCVIKVRSMKWAYDGAKERRCCGSVMKWSEERENCLEAAGVVNFSELGNHPCRPLYGAPAH